MPSSSLLQPGVILLLLLFATQATSPPPPPPPPPPSPSPPTRPHYPAFHIRSPRASFVGAPAGPFQFGDVFHLFVEENPHHAVRGRGRRLPPAAIASGKWPPHYSMDSMGWSHVMSRDLVFWEPVQATQDSARRGGASPLALAPESKLDADGVLGGSATVLPGLGPRLLYTCQSFVDEPHRKQCVARPRNASDPRLVEWVKDEAHNPVWEGREAFGPTKAWQGASGKLYVAVAADNSTQQAGAAAYLLESAGDDLTSLRDTGKLLYSSNTTGPWKWLDFFPLPLRLSDGWSGSGNATSADDEELDWIEAVPADHAAVGYGEPSNATTQQWRTRNGGRKWVFKATIGQRDYYSVGAFSDSSLRFQPDPLAGAIGNSTQRLDYGDAFCCSTTLLDDVSQRRILFGLVRELDSVDAAVERGWAGLISLPRVVEVDPFDRSGVRLRTPPVRELVKLRTNQTAEWRDLRIRGGETFLQLDLDSRGVPGDRTEFVLRFGMPRVREILAAAPRAEFGLTLRSSSWEWTRVGFVCTREAGWFAYIDHRFSSTAKEHPRNITRTPLYLSLKETALHLRVFVDKSVIEAFFQNGRVAMTSRVYPVDEFSSDAALFHVSTGAAVPPVHVEHVQVFGMRSIWPKHLLPWLDDVAVVDPQLAAARKAARERADKALGELADRLINKGASRGGRGAGRGGQRMAPPPLPLP